MLWGVNKMEQNLDYEEKRNRFIRQLLRGPICRAEDLTRWCLSKRMARYSAYDTLTTTVKNPEPSTVCSQDLIDFSKIVYDCWYDYICETSPETVSNKPQLNPQKMPAEKCYEYIFGERAELFMSTGLHPMLSQSKEDPSAGDKLHSDFIHVMPYGAPKDISCRLYLNLLPENAMKLGEILLKDGLKNKRKTYFKFSTENSRNDTFLIYTNYHKVQEFVDLLRQIKTQRPELFEGCENAFPTMPMIDGFIAFGEEPKYAHSSYNLERANAIDEFYAGLERAEIEAIGNYSSTIKTSDGQQLGLEEYLKYRIRKSFIETVYGTKKDIEAGIYPKRYRRTPAKIANYIEVENKIFEKCKDGFPDFLEEQLDENVRSIIKELKEGRVVAVPEFEFKTKKNNLSMYGQEIADEIIAEQGYIAYYKKVNIDLKEKLFNVFGVREKIYSKISEEGVSPYFIKHHISPELPFLNIETVDALKKEGLNKPKS